MTAQTKSANAPLEAYKATFEWGDAQARSLWDNLYARFAPVIDGRTVLDLGCSWGYMLKFLAERFRPARLIGTDISPLWNTVDHGWAFGAEKVPIEFHEARLTELTDILRGTVDYVLCTSVLQYMRPEEVLATLEAAFEVLRPGGEMLLRTRCFTSYIGADLHTYYDQDYVHLLYPLRELHRDMTEVLNKKPRYLNYLTASNYTALFMQSGLEPVSARRRDNSRSPEIQADLEQRYPWISAEELRCAEVEAHLIRPIQPSELTSFAPIQYSYPQTKDAT